MDFIFKIGKKIIPKKVFNIFQPAYHYALGFLGALAYGFPSKKMTVIGVTGTKGKTTTSYLIAQILNSTGYKTGMATTVLFKIGEKEWLNESKQTMLGRFQLQKLFSQMVEDGCKYAVVETSSEGILQYRHRFIDYDMAVFTNLSPEHIERHGGFENYRDAKVKLFEKVAQKESCVGIYNLDDKNVGHFLKPKISKQYVCSAKIPDNFHFPNLNKISDIKSGISGTTFSFSAGKESEKFEMPLIGEFNVYNAAAAICVALSQNIPMAEIKKILAEIKPVPGRMEIVDSGQNFTVIVDYAHEPASLEAAYKAVSGIRNQELGIKNKKAKLICLLGGQGGGRDKWKRPEMGKIAAKYCDNIILTNEDPYDESPENIINDIETGVRINRQNQRKSAVYKIIDRREAIKKAISLAKSGDIVILTGKGGEVWMCVEDGKKIPWDERKVVEEILKI